MYVMDKTLFHIFFKNINSWPTYSYINTKNW